MKEMVLVLNTMNNNNNHPYTVDELAQISTISRGTIYNAIKSGNPPFKVIRIMDTVRIERSSADKWLEGI